MRKHVSRARLVAILQDDDDLVTRLVDEGIIELFSEGVAVHDVHRALIARTLVRELEINWAGVDVILSMREQIQATHRQVADLVAALEAASQPDDDRD